MLDLDSKAAVVTRHLARHLISIAIGEQMPTTNVVASELEVGFGTVEKAVSTLRSNNVITTRSRGQMGTFLTHKDIPALWRIADLGTMIGLIPLPHALTFIGLATGTTIWLEHSGIPFSINFKNGARSRLRALLEERADFIVLSRRSAESACREHTELVTLIELSEWSYYSGHEIVYRRGIKKDRSDWVIGVDSTSFDHVALCDEVFPNSKRREIHYLNLPYAVAKGAVDATLLHSRALVPIDLANALESEPVSSSDLVLRSASAAVFLARKSSEAVRAVFADVSESTELINRIQNDVMHGNREPEY